MSESRFVVTIEEIGIALRNAYVSHYDEIDKLKNGNEAVQKYMFEKFGLILSNDINEELQFEFDNKSAYVLFMLEWS